MLSIYREKKRRLPPFETYGEREVCTNTIAGRAEYKRRTYEMEKRQDFRCAICTRIAGSRMQFDHQAGRGSGAGHRDDRILTDDGAWLNAALCHGCNLAKGSRRYEWSEGNYIPVRRAA